jgi:uncharacterized protein (DUF486 family)
MQPPQESEPTPFWGPAVAASERRAGGGPRWIVVPLMLSAASLFMAFAWIGHLRFKELPFLYALGLCWLLVLPEYYLNVKAIRMGYRIYSGAQMAAFRLCSGVVFVALVARFVLNEELGGRQLLGFGVMFVAMLLIAFPEGRRSIAGPRAGAARDANG